MLHALVHRQDGKIAGARQPPMAEQGLQRAQHAGLAVFLRHHAIHVVRPRQVQHILGNSLALVGQQTLRFISQQLDDIGHFRFPC